MTPTPDFTTATWHVGRRVRVRVRVTALRLNATVIDWWPQARLALATGGAVAVAVGVGRDDF